MDGATLEGVTLGQSCFPRADLERAFAARLGLTALAPEHAAFIDQVHEDCGPGEFPGLSAEDVAAWLADFWTFAEAREPDTPKLRLTPGDPAREPRRDRLEIVQNDRPFLVDSVMGELTDAGLTVRAMFHPVVEVRRNAEGRRDPNGALRRESLIWILLDPVGLDRAEPLLTGVRETLADVKAAVADYPAMLALMRRSIDALKAAPATSDAAWAEEEIAFLEWVANDHFVLLGARVYEYPRTKAGDYAPEEPLYEPEGSLGVLRDQSRTVLRRSSEPAVLTPQLQRLLRETGRVSVAKSNMRSRVHRRVNADYVGVRRYGPDGQPVGEVRFVGLFTAEAYEQATRDVPLIRRKVNEALRRAGKARGGHSEKRLRHILETWSRDELFQIAEDELYAIASGVLHLYDRPRVKLFVRRDPFDRFASILLYVPRDRYDSGVRERAGRILAEAFHGRVSAYYPFFSDDPLARVHFIIGLNPGDHAEPDLAELEEAITETARTWEDRFEEAVRFGEVDSEAAPGVIARWRDAFPAGYRDRNDAREALTDLGVLGGLSPDNPVRVRAYRDKGDPDTCFRFKLYRYGQAAPLSDVLPILEDMGLKALIEEGFPVRPVGADADIWVHAFVLDDPRGKGVVFEDIKRAFEDAVEAVWTGKSESDGFNRLALQSGVGWRDAALIRALARYRQQSGLASSQQVQEAAFADHPAVTRLILDLFSARFDPAHDRTPEQRAGLADAAMEDILQALQDVPSLDADRALRRVALVVQAMTRTNYYQRDADGRTKDYMAFKIASRELEDLPAPKPYREIFVWSPRVEGVHLRFGPVARGGLRWSDRRDDFRTEVLGLVKAQQVKNAVIVPVGSKGGFYPKRLPPRGAAPDAVRAEAIEAYKVFLRGLLDLTDNIDADNQVVPPKDVVRHEGDDPYLVVAADKGTATFSDIANAVSAEYGFWLGDAFASGGSVGYDHKAMGITARGAWEAVKRHFREIGKDIQSEPFTVVGVGDMSGDVFGNGMLLSKATRLIAAFDHRDVFLDPDPDPAASWAERKRLFDLPRSSWQDYDKAKISAGGGVFPRALKSITVSAEVKAALGIAVDELSPADLMKAILKADAELLYLGGIGTYVRAPQESDASVGDKANDQVRVTGDELRVAVVGEGANLGLTQAGRIAFALNGGRINTDAIDNSAGVDTSDHEVNIKILTGMAERTGELKPGERDPLLASMTDEVAAHVLAHNYDQTLALSLMEAAAPRDLDFYARLMTRMESQGRLDRAVEGLPDATEIAERQAAGRGLTRPELAVLLAYAKIVLSDEIVASAAPDDPYFIGALVGYFPDPLKRFDSCMRAHRLRRDIVATVLSNDIVNMAGATFPSRLTVSAGCDAGQLVTAFEAARRVFRLDEAWDAVNALDLKVSAASQLALTQEVQLVLRRQTYWLARRAARGGAQVQELLDAYRPTADALQADGAAAFSPLERQAAERRAAGFIEAGVPAPLARQIAALRPLTATSDIADVAKAEGWPALEAARVYHQTGAVFHLDRLRHAAHGLTSADHYERLAVRRLIEDVLTEQAAIAQAVMKRSSPSAAGSVEAAQRAVSAWARDASRAATAETARRTIDEVEQSGSGWSFAKLTIANSALRELAAAAR